MAPSAAPASRRRKGRRPSPASARADRRPCRLRAPGGANVTVGIHVPRASASVSAGRSGRGGAPGWRRYPPPGQAIITHRSVPIRYDTARSGLGAGAALYTFGLECEPWALAPESAITPCVTRCCNDTSRLAAVSQCHLTLRDMYTFVTPDATSCCRLPCIAPPRATQGCHHSATIRCCTVRCETVQHRTTRNGAVPYNARQRNAM